MFNQHWLEDFKQIYSFHIFPHINILSHRPHTHVPLIIEGENNGVSAVIW